MEAKIKALIKRWEAEAKRIQAKSQKTWRDLESGKVDQIDSVIYSVYENQTESVVLAGCAHDLKKLLGDT